MNFNPSVLSVVFFRINRNIVECKYKQGHGALDIRGAVLIETLWNVNSFIHVFLELFPLVLIETLWNVNVSITVNDEIIWTVLIETLWNVNESVLPL